MAARSRPGEVRIPRGQFRGRRLRFDPSDGLRPTAARTLEALLSIVQPLAATHSFLDAFSGSGLVGFSAASIGFNDVVMVERHLPAVDQLKRHASALDSAVRIVAGDVFKVWPSIVMAQPLLVYADPPFTDESALLRLQTLLSQSSLSDVRLVIEHPTLRELPLIESAKVIDQRAYGRSTLTQLTFSMAHNLGVADMDE